MKNKYKMAKYYLYNYKNIDKLIDERREEIIDGVCNNLGNCLRGINTIETQVIALIEDKRIRMLKKQQVFVGANISLILYACILAGKRSEIGNDRE